MPARTTSLEPSTGDRNLSSEDIKVLGGTWQEYKKDAKEAAFDLFVK